MDTNQKAIDKGKRVTRCMNVINWMKSQGKSEAEILAYVKANWPKSY